MFLCNVRYDKFDLEKTKLFEILQLQCSVVSNLNTYIHCRLEEVCNLVVQRFIAKENEGSRCQNVVTFIDLKSSQKRQTYH